jgi:hypothetical protein
MWRIAGCFLSLAVLPGCAAKTCDATGSKILASDPAIISAFLLHLLSPPSTIATLLLTQNSSLCALDPLGWLELYKHKSREGVCPSNSIRIYIDSEPWPQQYAVTDLLITTKKDRTKNAQALATSVWIPWGSLSFFSRKTHTPGE